MGLPLGGLSNTSTSTGTATNTNSTMIVDRIVSCYLFVLGFVDVVRIGETRITRYTGTGTGTGTSTSTGAILNYCRRIETKNVRKSSTDTSCRSYCCPKFLFVASTPRTTEQ